MIIVAQQQIKLRCKIIFKNSEHVKRKNINSRCWQTFTHACTLYHHFVRLWISLVVLLITARKNWVICIHFYMHDGIIPQFACVQLVIPPFFGFISTGILDTQKSTKNMRPNKKPLAHWNFWHLVSCSSYAF